MSDFKVKKFNQELLSLFFKNLGVKQTIAKNIFWLALSEIIPKAVVAVLAMITARYLGVEGFGKFSFAFSFALVFSVIVDFGFVPFTTREVARDESLAKKFLENISTVKVILSVVAFGAIFIVLGFLKKPSDVMVLVLFSAIWMIIQSFARFFQSIFRASEKMEYVAFLKIFYSLVLFTIVFCAVMFNFGAVAIVQSYVLAIAISLVATLILVRLKFFSFGFKIDPSFWSMLIKEIWPFMAFTVFAAIYFQIAVVMLSVIDTDLSVGLYSAAFNLVVVFLVISDVVSSSALPSLSKMFGKSDMFKHLTKKLVLAMLVIGLFLSIVLFLSAPFVIKLIYGNEFLGAVSAFKIMIWILPLRFMNYLFGASLLAGNMQKSRLGASMICAVFNVVINFALIPLFSFVGAAIATLVTEAILFILYSKFYNKVIKTI